MSDFPIKRQRQTFRREESNSSTTLQSKRKERLFCQLGLWVDNDYPRLCGDLHCLHVIGKASGAGQAYSSLPKFLPLVFTNASAPLAAAVSLTMEPSDAQSSKGR